jgi:hypothetical protein
MRKKIAAFIGLIALVLVAAAGFDPTWPERTERIPLRVGMTGEEVDLALDQPKHSKELRATTDWLLYSLKPDRFADGENVAVFFDDQRRVVRWEKCPRANYHRRSSWESFKFVIGMK